MILSKMQFVFVAILLAAWHLWDNCANNNESLAMGEYRELLDRTDRGPLESGWKSCKQERLHLTALLRVYDRKYL